VSGWADVVALASELPEFGKGTSHGRPTWKKLARDLTGE
jgi:hypothetical protein